MIASFTSVLVFFVSRSTCSLISSPFLSALSFKTAVSSFISRVFVNWLLITSVCLSTSNFISPTLSSFRRNTLLAETYFSRRSLNSKNLLVGRSASARFPIAWIGAKFRLKAANASFANCTYWSNVTLSILGAAVWQRIFLRRHSWSIDSASVSSWSPLGLFTDGWNESRAGFFFFMYLSSNYLNFFAPLPLGKANVLAQMVAVKITVQSQSWMDLLVGISFLPASLQRCILRTAGESSQSW